MIEDGVNLIINISASPYYFSSLVLKFVLFLAENVLLRAQVFGELRYEKKFFEF